MPLLRRVGAATLLCTAGVLAHPVPAFSQTAITAPGAGGQPLRDGHDGQHDFDFNIGVWRTHIHRVLDPLAGGRHSIEMTGVVTIRKVWGGRASLEEIEADGPKGHWEALSLFLYNPQTGQWSRSFVNARDPVLSGAFVGSFKNGRGQLFLPDTIDGRAVLVRGVFADIKPDSHTYTESYSDDGGATWRMALIAHLTREPQ